MQKKVIIIGSGFAGLSAACFMRKAGWDVTVLEKNATAGGRAAQLKSNGFVFDMGPSWYWMPDVFERFFSKFGKKVGDYYSLKRLDPSYRIYWNDSVTDIPADYDALQQLFEQLEPGSGAKLDTFINEAAYKYEVGMNKLVFKPGLSLTEFLDAGLIRGIFKLDVFNSMQKHVSKFFKNEKLKQLLEFPVLFLGALPSKIPALYSLMNYADIKGGTWYPEGGMYSIVESIVKLAEGLGVVFEFNSPVKKIDIADQKVKGVTVINSTGVEKVYECDTVIAAADYHHVETVLLPEVYRSYPDKYWDSRVMAPGCIIFYIGLNKKLQNILHHSLFFDTSFEVHGQEIYETKRWPCKPLFYVCAASATDKNVAPEGCENLFVLIPVASGLVGDTETLREHYFNMVVERMEQRLGENIKEHIVFKQSFAQTEFVEVYNAFKGNAYGLANTLMQTAVFKPKCVNKKVRNLFYAGQLTVPGPGVPPSIISGEVVANEVIKRFK